MSKDFYKKYAGHRYESLSSEYFKLITQIREKEQELKRQQKQNQKLEVLANKASQALDEVWD